MCFGSSTGGVIDRGMERLLFLRRLQRKNASAARAIKATGTPTAGPIIAPRLFDEEGGEGVDDCAIGTAVV